MTLYIYIVHLWSGLYFDNCWTFSFLFLTSPALLWPSVLDHHPSDRWNFYHALQWSRLTFSPSILHSVLTRTPSSQNRNMTTMCHYKGGVDWAQFTYYLSSIAPEFRIWGSQSYYVEMSIPKHSRCPVEFHNVDLWTK